MKKLFLCLLIALPLLGPVYSQSEKNEAAEHRRAWQNIISQLHLSGSQRKSLDGIVKGVRHDILPLKAAEKEKRTELTAILENPNPDRNAAKAKLQEIMSIRMQRHLRFADAYFDTLAILNPAQKKIFTKLAAKRMSGEHH